MDKTYYESLGIIYESYEEGYISEETKTNLIDKIKSIKNPIKNKKELQYNKNKTKMLQNLKNAIDNDAKEDGDKLGTYIKKATGVQKEYDKFGKKNLFKQNKYQNLLNRLNRTSQTEREIGYKLNSLKNNLKNK